MKYTLLLPVRDNRGTGVVVVWHREIGQYIAPDEPLITLRFGDEDEEIRTDVPGVLFKALVLPGETIEGGEPLAVLAGVAGKIALPPPPAPAPSPYLPAGPEEVVIPSPAARALAAHHARSMRESPHVTTLATVDLAEALRLSAKESDDAGVLPFVVAAVASALRLYPDLNAQRLTEGEIRRKGYIHIALPQPALDVPGIAAPVVYDADKKSIRALAREIVRLRQAVRERTLPAAAQRGATFTITDLSATGIAFQTPLLHQPQAAHLSLGTPTGGIGHLCLAHDARLVDGWAAAMFLAEVKSHLEEARFLFV